MTLRRTTLPRVAAALSCAAFLPAQHPATKSTAPIQHRAGAPEASTTLGAAWQDFLRADPGGTWWSRWSPATGTPMEIYGSGLPIADWRGDTLEEGRRCAGRLLQQESRLLGLGDCEFRERIGARMGETWAFVYDQYHRGLQVIGGRADVRVHRVGRIPMFGSVAWPIPDGFSIVPTLGEEAATAIVWQRVGAPATVKQPGAPRQPRLVIWGDALSPTRAPVFLAWEIPISNVDADGVGPIGRWYVDAHDGELLHWESDKHEGGDGCDGSVGHGGGPGGEGSPAVPLVATGTVVAPTRTGLVGGGALVTVPVAGVAVVTGQGTVYTDANGAFSVGLPLFTASTSATFGLDGVHNQAIVGNNAPGLSRTLFAGSNGTITLPVVTDNQAAHSTAYYWIYTANEYCRALFGNTPQMIATDNVQPFVNVAGVCNSYYANHTIGFYQAGSGCVNTAFSTVIVHEWGHELDDRYGGISNSTGDGLSEGWGDVLAMYVTDGPLVGDGFYSAGGFLRTGNNTTVYPPPAEVHAAGEVWMGFAWQVRQNLAVALFPRSQAIAASNRAVLGSIVANATDQLGAYLQVYIADDDDGNLANLTPFTTEIKAAGDTKHYPYPLAAPPVNDECSGAIRLTNNSWGPIDNSLALDSAPDWYCSLSGSKDLWYSYVAGVGPLTISTCSTGGNLDTVLEVFSGTCGALTSIGCNDDACSSYLSSVTVNITTPGIYYFRVGGFANDSGPMTVSVQGTPGQLASGTPFGTGCNRLSKAFYEEFAPGTFDLGLSSMRMLRSGAVYNVTAGGGVYHAPGVGATVLALGDDSQVAVGLAGSFPYPGGSTAQLVVCSNGFVSPGIGNGVSPVPEPGSWVTMPLPCWGCWHDFDPTRGGSGQVKFEQIGSMAYVTWDNVMDYHSTNGSIWQLQFDLATGNVTFVWVTMSYIDSWVVGYTPGGVHPDEGSRDLSATLPFPTRSADVFPLALGATSPTVGGNAVLTATRFPATSTLGAILLGFAAMTPGLDLAGYGMPTCSAYVGSPNVTLLVFPSAGSANYVQPIPNDGNLMGLPLIAQAFAFAPGANAAGVLASNGVDLRVGF